jgi:hypothetical protein
VKAFTRAGPNAAPTMTETERATIVRDLNRQHDKVLNDLDALNQQVEQALAAVRPPNSEALQ